VKVLGLITSDASNHRTLFVGTSPHKFFLTTTHVYLAEVPCNMGETQHKPVIEIGKAQEALKLIECFWGYPVIDDLDLSWIHMYAMLINDVAQVMYPVHAEGAFFQVGVYLVLSQIVQNLLNMLQVFSPSLVVN
jgi:hypothetical protein